MTATQAPPTYSSADVVRQTDISHRMLIYYTDHGYLRSHWRSKDGRILADDEPGGYGYDRAWTQDELDRAQMMARLIALGVTAQQAARIARRPAVRELWLTNVMAACKAMEP